MVWSRLAAPALFGLARPASKTIPCIVPQQLSKMLNHHGYEDLLSEKLLVLVFQSLDVADLPVHETELIIALTAADDVCDKPDKFKRKFAELLLANSSLSTSQIVHRRSLR